MKKIIFGAMALLMGLTFTACPVDPAPETGPDTKWFIGHESNTSYSLGTANQLAGLAELVNSGINFSGKTLTLTQDIHLDAAASLLFTRTTSTTSNWTPIGTAANPFKGVFDGSGKKIIGIVINDCGLKYMSTSLWS